MCGTLCQRKANAYELTSVQNLKTHTRADRQTNVQKQSRLALARGGGCGEQTNVVWTYGFKQTCAFFWTGSFIFPEYRFSSIL